MPLIEPKSDCRKFARLDWATRNFYWTLRTHLDPEGRHSADPEFLISTLFPFERDRVRLTNITRWLEVLRHAGFVRCYTDSKSQPIVEVPEAVQHNMRFRKSKHEAFDGGQAGLCLEDDPPPKKPPSIKLKSIDSKLREEKRREEKEPARERDLKEDEELKGAVAHGAAEVPDEKKAIEQAGMRSIPADFAKICFEDWMSNGGCNAIGVAKPWLKYVGDRWRNESVDWRNGTHRGKKRVGEQKAERIGPSKQDVADYFSDKWGDDPRCAGWAVQFHSQWSQRGWKRKEILIDWKVEASTQVSRWRGGI